MRPATRGSISVDMLKPASPRPRMLDGAKRVMTNRASSHRPAITNQVRHDQRSREEDLAKDEVAEKAVPFAAGDTAGQKAMAVQMTADRIDQSHQPRADISTSMSRVSLSFVGIRLLGPVRHAGARTAVDRQRS